MSSVRVLVAALVLSAGVGGDAAGAAQTKQETALLAGGCFWCMQAPFEKVKGVTSVVAGYAGGTGKNPTYDDYARKGYVEAVRVTFDPAQIAYAQLLNVFWRQIDPTDLGGQFVDRGPQYRSVIFYGDAEQRRVAEKSVLCLSSAEVMGRSATPT